MRADAEPSCTESCTASSLRWFASLYVRAAQKDLEIIVLRHQLDVLRRQVDRPEVTDADRSLLAAIAAALPRPSRAGWLATPDTLLRWHRCRIARHWAQPQRPPGRPSTSAEPIRDVTPPSRASRPTASVRHIRECPSRLIYGGARCRRKPIRLPNRYSEGNET